MRYEFAKAENLSLRLEFLPSRFMRFLLNLSLITGLLVARAPMAKAQVSNTEQTDGTISGTVLLKTNNRPPAKWL